MTDTPIDSRVAYVEPEPGVYLPLCWHKAGFTHALCARRTFSREWYVATRHRTEAAALAAQSKARKVAEQLAGFHGVPHETVVCARSTVTSPNADLCSEANSSNGVPRVTAR